MFGYVDTSEVCFLVNGDQGSNRFVNLSLSEISKQ
jgi:hypothetical protein